MPRYRIHRMKDTQRESFRWAAHTGGLALVKPKDYELDGEVEAATPYSAWRLLMSEGRPLRAGDLLETYSVEGVATELRIVKYIGCEPAEWFIPETKPHEDLHRGEFSASGSTEMRSQSL